MNDKTATRITEVMVNVDNPLVTGFASILCDETEHSTELIIEFFNYWDNFSNGTYDGYLIFSHDCIDDDITTGILFSEDNIVDMLHDYIDNVVPIEFNRLRDDIKRVKHVMKCDAVEHYAHIVQLHTRFGIIDK